MSLIGTQAVLASPIGVGSVNDTNDGHSMVAIIDPVDHAIGAAAGAMPSLERPSELFADALWVVQHRTNDELIRRKRHGRRQVLRELSPSRR